MKLFANLILGTALSACIWASALACGSADAHDTPDPVLIRSREMAAKYVNIQVAKAEGYQQLFECTTHDEHGTMGVHFIHPGRAGDGKLVLGEPDVLTYEPESDGSMQLVGMEYIVFEKDWKGKGVPEFLGALSSARRRWVSTRWTLTTSFTSGIGGTIQPACSPIGTPM